MSTQCSLLIACFFAILPSAEATQPDNVSVRVSVQLDAGAGPTTLAESQRILCIELAVASACVQSMAGAHRVAQSLIPAHSRASDRFAKE